MQTIEITDGTGRFEDATGSATITEDFDLNTFVYDGRFVGSISQPGRRNCSSRERSVLRGSTEEVREVERLG